MFNFLKRDKPPEPTEPQEEIGYLKQQLKNAEHSRDTAWKEDSGLRAKIRHLEDQLWATEKALTQAQGDAIRFYEAWQSAVRLARIP